MSRFSGLFIPDQRIELLDMRCDERSSTLQSIQEIDPHPVLVEGDTGWQVLHSEDLPERDEQSSPNGPVWLQMSREAIFGTPVPRLCVTVPAGVGKTTAVEQLQVLRPQLNPCLLYTSPSPRDRTRSRMPSSA